MEHFIVHDHVSPSTKFYYSTCITHPLYIWPYTTCPYLSLPVLYAQTLLHIAGQCLYRYHHLAQVHNYSPYRIIASMLTFQ